MAVQPTAAQGEFALQDIVSERRHRLLLSGELDLTATPMLEACLQEVCAEGTTSVTIDLSRLTFMDSNGVRMTLLARQLCEQHGCEFQLVQGPAPIRLLFETTGLLNYLPFTTALDHHG